MYDCNGWSYGHERVNERWWQPFLINIWVDGIISFTGHCYIQLSCFTWSLRLLALAQMVENGKIEIIIFVFISLCRDSNITCNHHQTLSSTTALLWKSFNFITSRVISFAALWLDLFSLMVHLPSTIICLIFIFDIFALLYGRKIKSNAIVFYSIHIHNTISHCCHFYFLFAQISNNNNNNITHSCYEW